MFNTESLIRATPSPFSRDPDGSVFPAPALPVGSWLNVARFVMAFVCLLTAFVARAEDEPRRVFVPTEALETLIAKDQRGVLLERAEFERLWELAKKNAVLNPPPPLATLIPRANYTAKVVGDQLHITVKATLQQLATDWQAIEFALPRLSLESVTLNEEAAYVGRSGEGNLTIFSPDAGAHQLVLELSTELATLGSDQVAVFGLLPSAAGELEITLPPGKRLLAGNTQLERPAAADQPATYRVAVGGLANIQLRITDRAADKAADVLAFATTGYGVHVTPGEATWHALTTLQIFGRPIDRLTLSVPGYLEVADVESTGLEAWELVDDAANPERTQIRLRYGQAFDGSRKVTVRGVLPTPLGEPWAIPPLTIEQVTSHIGQVLVQSPAGVRLQLLEAVGVRRASAQQKAVSDMPDDMSSFAAVESVRFDAWKEDFVLRLITQPKPRELSAALALLWQLTDAEVALKAAITLTPRFAPLFEVDVQLPVEWNVTSAAFVNAPGAEVPVAWERLPSDPGEQRIRLSLPTPIAANATGSVRIEIRRDLEDWPVEDEPAEIAWPELVLPQANLQETTFVVQAPGDLELVGEELTGLDAAPLKADWERLRFQSSDTRYSGRLKISRRPARWAVNSLAFFRIDPQTLSAHWEAEVTISGGGTRTLTVSLPEAVGSGVRFDVEGATLVEQQPQPVAEGHRSWRLQFAERVYSGVLITATSTLPRPAGVITAPLLRVLEAEREAGFLAVEAGPEQRISMETGSLAGSRVDEADVLDLPLPQNYLPKERLVGVYRTVGGAITLTLAEERFDKSAVPTAICPKLHLTSILSATGECQQQADFQLNLAGVPNLRLELPESATLWAVLLDGKPVEVRRRPEGYSLAIPGSAEVAHRLQVFSRDHIAPLRGTGRLQQPSPTLWAVSGQGADQPVAVLEQKWDVIYPHETLLVDSDGVLEPEVPLDRPGWLAGLLTKIRLPNQSHLLNRAMMLAIALAVLAVFIMTVQRRGWERGLIGLIAMGFIGLMVLLGLLLPALSGVWTAAPAAFDRIQGMRGGTSYEYEPVANAPTATPMMPPSAPMRGVQLGDGVVQQEVADGFSKPMSAPESAEAKSEAAPKDSRKEDTKSLEALDELSNLERKKWAAPAGPKAGGEVIVGEADKNVPQAAGRPMADGVQVAEPVAKPARKPSSGVETGGLLSLSLALETPAGSSQKSFRYLGDDRAAAALDLLYVERHSGATARLFWFLLGAVLAWFTRHVTARRQLLLIAIGLLITIGLAPVLPNRGQWLADALAFVTLGAAAAWLLWHVGDCLSDCLMKCRAWWVALVLIALTTPVGSAEEVQKANPRVATPGLPSEIHPNALVLPFDVNGDPLAAKRVFVPLDRFKQIWQQAHPEQPLRSPAPNNGGVMAAWYTAQLGQPQGNEAPVQVQARIALRSYVDGQTTIRLPLKPVALSSATLDDQPAVVIVQEQSLAIIVSKPGLHVLDLQFAVPAQISGAGGSFRLNLDPVAAGRLSFALPEKSLAVRVNGSTSVYRRVTEGDAASIELAIDRGGELLVSWQPEQEKGGIATTIQSDSVTAVTVNDAGVTISAGFQYRVRQGVIRDVSFRIPDTLKLKGVAGPDVGGWELLEAGAERKLRVFLRRNVNDVTALTIDGYVSHRTDVAPTSFNVPDIAPLEVTTDVGQVAVYLGEQLAVRADQVTGLQQIDAAGYQPAVPVTRPNQAPQLAYRFLKRPWSVALETRRLTAQLQTIAQHGVSIGPRKLRFTSRFECDVTVTPQSSLNIDVPAGWLVLDVQVAGLKDWYATVVEDRQRLTVEFQQPVLGRIELVLAATAVRAAGESVSLSSPQILGSQKTQQQMGVWLEPGLSARIEGTERWKSLDVAAVHPSLVALRPERLQLAFQASVADAGTIGLALETAQPQVTGVSLSAITVTDAAVVYGVILQWQVTGAATELLILETPDWLAGRLEFQGANLRDVQSTPVDGGRQRWTIGLRSPVQGPVLLAASAALPPANEKVLAAGLSFQSGTDGDIKPLETQQHFVLLTNLSQSQLTSDDPNRSEPVTREDVPLVVRQELIDQATELVRVRNASQAPSWSLARFVVTETTPASVNLADLVTVLTRDGSYRTQTTYTIKNRGRQFLALQFPEGTQLLSVFVADRPFRTVLAKVEGKAVHLVALPKTSAADLAFRVEVVYAGRLPAALPRKGAWQRNDLQLPAPHIITPEESSTFGIPVARTRWTIHLPDDLDTAPLGDPKRHNLNLVRGGLLADDADVRLLLLQCEELLTVATGSGSLRNRARAVNNLKSLEAQINQPNLAGVQANEKLSQEVVRVRSKLTELQTTVDQAKQQLPQLQQQVEFSDGESQLGLAYSNNGTLLGDNYDAFGTNASTRNEDQVNAFNFQIEKGASVAGKAAELAKQAAPIVGNSIEARQYYQNLNDRVLSDLNAQPNAAGFGNSFDIPFRQGSFGVDPNGRFSRGRALTSSGPAGAAGGMPGVSNAAPGVAGGTTSLGAVTDGFATTPLSDFSGPATESENLRRGGAMLGRRSGVWADDQARSQQRGYHLDRDADDFMSLHVVQPGMAGVGMGGGGFGGGMGGGMMGGGDVDGAAAIAPWTQKGGLSLKIQLPQAGQTLVFSKAGGDPQLGLAVRPRSALITGLGLFWAILCLAAVIAIGSALRLANRTFGGTTTLFAALAAFGLVAALLAPGLFAWLGGLVFLIGAGGLLCRCLFQPAAVSA